MASSVYSTLEELLSIRFHVKQRRLTQQQKLISQKGGYHQAIRKGRGMEFSEVREYAPGDDVRHIDWKVSARTQKTHTKLFTEELERPIVCVAEQSPKLFFGSQVRFKSAQAALNIMAALGWITLQQGDRFGGFVFNHFSHQWVEPRHHANAILQCLHQGIASQKQLRSPNDTDEWLWLNQLSRLQKHLRPGSRVFLIGDFLNPTDAFLGKLVQLKKHLDISLIHVFDQLETELPQAGILKITDGEHDLALNSLEAKQRQAYADYYDQAWLFLKQKMADLHLPLVAIASHEDPTAALMQQGVIR